MRRRYFALTIALLAGCGGGSPVATTSQQSMNTQLPTSTNTTVQVSAPPASEAETETTAPTTSPEVVAQYVPPAVEWSEPPPPAAADPYTSMEPCGGDLPPCYVKWRESHGDYTALNRYSGASGAWQFMDGTWGGYGGYSKAMYAPPEVQDQKAREVWNNGAGCSHWSAC